MNAVEIEQAVSALAEQPFEPMEFPFQFLEAFGNRDTTIKRLRKGDSNKSDIGGVLQVNNIHIVVAAKGETTHALAALKGSSATTRAKAKFVLATDGDTFEAEDLTTGETVACAYTQFPDHFGFFLPLAGITTVKQLRDSSFDIRATSRLNRLYVELLKDNPDWGTAARRPDMNHFMARLIFCFFAEDTDIFGPNGRFTATIEQMSAKDSSNTHEVIGTLFRAMNVRTEHHVAEAIPVWARPFPYVNGGLFSGSMDVPRFSRIARSYLLHVGHLDWTRINPDIFGSMIQAVADDEERGALGMHYTSVPNILKVLNPLFLDDLRSKLEDAGNNPRTLLNLRKRMSRIRVFDPACGSGNFLVIAYKEMRQIESEINARRGEAHLRSEIPLTNFRGIEVRDFPAEIARLALIITEYQCDLLYRGKSLALAEFLPLDAENWITCGNALRLDWLRVCPPPGARSVIRDGLFTSTGDLSAEFEHDSGETYVCGNPPYLGSRWLTREQKIDMARVFAGRTVNWKSLDYVAAWFMKAADYCEGHEAMYAFVATNSICQGQQVSALWPPIQKRGYEIAFAHTSFKWQNLASFNAGVMVVIVGVTRVPRPLRIIWSTAEGGSLVARSVGNINAYLVAGPNTTVEAKRRPTGGVATMQFGNHPYYAAALILSAIEARKLILSEPRSARFVRPLYGSRELISGEPRACLWIHDDEADEARSVPLIAGRIEMAAHARIAATHDAAAQNLASVPHRFRDQSEAVNSVLIVPRVSSVNRSNLPVGLLTADAIVQDQAFALFDAPLWNMAIIASRLHLVWVATVCGRMKTDFRYSNTLGWNTFPVPTLTAKNYADLTRTAEDILLSRESHFPATIADLYDPDEMPADLREAHERNDEILERIYIGRRFRNDTERLEKLFELYSKMTASQPVGARRTKRRKT